MWSLPVSVAQTCTPATMPTNSPTRSSLVGYDRIMRPHESVIMGHEFSGRVVALRSAPPPPG